ncbi:MAG TPA: CsbD family protein [Planctomycetota bacterium]|jgi:uncharacterized protein YjbJ (UPF0337 family)|nr:CsbD family protein [Planctomycetota bacterium]
MDRNEIIGKWHQIKGEVKKKWGSLTDDDFKMSEGDMESLAGRIQEKYGLAKDKVKTDLDQLMNSIFRKPEDKDKKVA